MLKLRQLVIYFVTPVYWKLSKRQKVKALQEFSLIERDSACQIQDAIRCVDDPKTKAGLFQHVLEEYSHADLFGKISDKFADAPTILPVVTRDRLVPDKKGDFNALDFLTYVYVGERDVNSDFSVYAKTCDQEVSAVFEQVQADEAGHEANTLQVLKRLAGGNKLLLFWKLRKSEVLLRYRAYVGYSRRFGELALTVILVILYFSFGWILARSFKKRLRLSDKEQLSIFSKHEEALSHQLQKALQGS